MKKIYFAIILIVFFCFALISSNSKNNSEIKNVLDNQINEWNKGSVEGFMMGYWNSPELKFITSRGVKKGYEEVKNSYLKNYNTKEKMGKLEFSHLEFSNLSKNMELVIGQWKVTKTNHMDSGKFSLIFKKIKKDWKIIVDHTW